MGLETATFIGGLTPAWPLATDTKSQGDDHLRLIKAVLQASFPNASKAFYFPTAEAISGTQTLDVTDMNNTQYVDTSGGNVAMTLPTLAAADKGWQIEVVKVGTDVNAVIVSPTSGSILSKSGSTATIRVGVAYEPARFFWNGAAWYCFKPGPMIGSTENFNGATVPPGYLAEDGSVYSNTAFAELFAVLAATTLKDKRGRTEIGDGTGAGLTARVLGTAYGAETHQLALGETPTGITVAGTFVSTASTWINSDQDTNTFSTNAGGASVWRAWNTGAAVARGQVTGSVAATSNNTGGGAHNNMQPSIAAKKIIRAC